MQNKTVKSFTYNKLKNNGLQSNLLHITNLKTTVSQSTKRISAAINDPRLLHYFQHELMN